MNCKQCGVELPIGSNPRLEFCKPAHRQAYFRKQHFTQDSTALVTLSTQVQDQAQRIADLEAVNAALVKTLDRERSQHNEYLQRTVENVEQAQEVAELERENTRLKNKLDYERRYLEDSTPQKFKAWLKKQPTSPWRTKFLSDQLVPARGSRAHYEAHLRRLGCTDEEHADFVRLWKLMLLQS